MYVQLLYNRALVESHPIIGRSLINVHSIYPFFFFFAIPRILRFMTRDDPKSTLTRSAIVRFPHVSLCEDEHQYVHMMMR
jgi:hypothetical protein